MKSTIFIPEREIFTIKNFSQFNLHPSWRIKTISAPFSFISWYCFAKWQKQVLTQIPFVSLSFPWPPNHPPISNITRVLVLPFPDDKYWYLTFCCRLPLGVLLESDWDATRLCRRMEQSWLRVQRTRRDLAGDSSFRESGRLGSQLSRRLHQPRKCAEGGEDLWPVSNHLYTSPDLIHFWRSRTRTLR